LQERLKQAESGYGFEQFDSTEVCRVMQALPGFRDFYPEDCARRNHIVSIWRKVAKRYGFVEFDGPVLESTDLYRFRIFIEKIFQSLSDSHFSLVTLFLERFFAAAQFDFRQGFLDVRIFQFVDIFSFVEF
jgi:hypothetical protein